MNGPEYLNSHEGHESAEMTMTENFNMTRQDIDRYVARAHQLRAERLGEWGRQIAQTWASLFRRHGRLLPSNSKFGERVVHTGQI
jgi:hypothetical protein